MALTPEQIKAIRAQAGVAEAPMEEQGVSLTERLGIKEPESPLRRLDAGKAALGGIASGVGGIALTGIEKVGKALTGKDVDLHAKLKTQFGGDQYPKAFGAGQLGGEVASLAAPVGAVGKLAKVGAEAIGAGQKTAKLTQAATEGVAFTAGQGLAQGEKQSLEDYAINAGLNVALPGVGMVAKSVGENMPARIINSLIKPLQKDFAYGKNPGKSVADLGITGNSFEDLINNIKTKKNEVGELIGSKLSQLAVPEQIDLVQTLGPIDEAIKNAYKTPRTNRTLIDRLRAVKDDIVDNFDVDNLGVVSLEQAQELKKTIGDLTKWTDNVSDDQAVNKALQKTYTAIRDKMDNVLKNKMSPEDFAQYKKASEDYGNLISAENAAVHRDKITSRNDLVSLGAKNAGLITGLTAAVASGGAALPAVLAGLAGTVVDKITATPAFKTRLASLLSKLAPKEVETFFDKVPTAKSLFDEQQIKDFIGDFEGAKLNRGSVDIDEIGKVFNRDELGKFSPETAVKRVKDIVTKALPEDDSDTVRYLADTLENKRTKGAYREIAREDAAKFLEERGLFGYDGPLTEKDDAVLTKILKELEKVSDDLELVAKEAEMSTPLVKSIQERMI